MIKTVAQDKVNLAEQQIEEKKREIDYDTREFTLEIIVNKYLTKERDKKTLLYVPEYQREFVWSYTHQSRFIESIILGLPIPLIFVAVIKETGRLEIVDGSQRIRTLVAFFEDELRLVNLKTLSHLNGFFFKDLSLSRQRKLQQTAMRMIVLSDKADEDVRNDMFSRINTGGVDLRDMERRKGIYTGDFLDFIFECGKHHLLNELCAINRNAEQRYEKEELVLRFFAFSDTYPHFTVSRNQCRLGPENDNVGITRFLDYYILEKNDRFSDDEKKKKEDNYVKMLEFVKETFPSGFKQYKNHKYTARSYFEAISVGSFLALKNKPDISVHGIWQKNEVDNTNGPFFVPLDKSYHLAYKRESVIKRIDYVKDKLIAFS